MWRDRLEAWAEVQLIAASRASSVFRKFKRSHALEGGFLEEIAPRIFIWLAEIIVVRLKNRLRSLNMNLREARDLLTDLVKEIPILVAMVVFGLLRLPVE